MIGISFRQKGDFKNTDKFFNDLLDEKYLKVLKRYGDEGVRALSAATPVRSGKTASSWRYEISKTDTGYSLEFINTNVDKGVNIAVILQYGHGTGTGGWIEGRDYINPAIQPIFDEILNDVWKEVCK